ncbi:predicted protein [Uncinocarpus reesii 1704]|uniref:Uncharacterized protein n=1 Tax=Uncinocarpus reesii (strain UAMH 1704) TaxID=336963 RepID=C4JRU0_UNCRE|nr:uncharacterized protein UREG_05179 [Uncinocarpus reesii 1704]EEP80337.1 predicted protein [Uncinocarpus reesii 1704]
MALWPFNRKKNRTRKQGDGLSSSSSGQVAGSLSRTTKSETSIPFNHGASTTTAKPNRRHSKRRKNGRDQAASGNEDTCVPPRQIMTPSPIPPADLDTSPSFHASPLPRSERVGSPAPRIFSSTKLHAAINMSQNSLARSINDIPTLRNNRIPTEPGGLLRRKSSKRKRNDYAREQAIKNMSLQAINTYRPPRSHRHWRFAPQIRPAALHVPRFPSVQAQRFRHINSSSCLALRGNPAIRTYTGTPKIRRQQGQGDRRRRAARRSAGQKPAKQPERAPVYNHNATDLKLDTGAALAEQKSDQMELSQTTNRSGSWLQDPSKESFGGNGNGATHAQAQETLSLGDDEKSFVHVIGSKSDALSQLAEQGMASNSDVSRAQRSERRLSSNAGRIGRSLSSFFRRGSRFRREPRTQNSEGPSFSVPSRESFSRISHTEAAGMPSMIPKKSSLRFDGQSMQSRFTEHFDEPVSPENIRSSTAIDIYPTSNRLSVCTGKSTATEAHDLFRASGANSPDTRPNSMLLAQSLASIDSEGSWLSGKPSRRLSQARLGQYRGSAESKDDPTDSPEDRTASDGPVPVPVPEEDEEDAEVSQAGKTNLQDGEATTWHSSVGKRARLVSPGTRAKSNEGLFTEFLENASDAHTPETDSPVDIEGEMEVRRATSVDLGKGHIRHISAGSAKLLNLPPRQSEDRRRSSGAISSGALPSMTVSEQNRETDP